MAEPVVLVPYDPAWPARFARERERIAAALGDVTEGGVLDGVEHIGSTSVPGMTAKPCLDIAARVHPFPLEEEKIRALQALGFEYLGEHGIPGRLYFRRGPHAVHLHVFGVGSEHWARHLVFRDYLRASSEAAERYRALKVSLAARFRDDRAAYTDGKAALVRELEREAFAWHVAATGFTPIHQAAAELEGLTWLASSGWAIALFLGTPARYHDDVDLVVFRDEAEAARRHLSARGWRLDLVVEGRYTQWEPGQGVPEVVHQIHARRDGAFLDLLLTRREAGCWLYRRDERLRLPLERARRWQRGLPYLAPEAALLYKSRVAGQPPRPKDEADFRRALPHLDAEQRAWLREGLELTAPGHPWLAHLGGNQARKP
jgi:GrpB-like predicted nucleotidyltransferase (UPF0157 family)